MQTHRPFKRRFTASVIVAAVLSWGFFLLKAAAVIGGANLCSPPIIQRLYSKEGRLFGLLGEARGLRARRDSTVLR